MKYYYRTGVLIPFIQKFYKLLIVAFTAVFALTMVIATLRVDAATTTIEINGDTASGENDKGGWLFNRDLRNGTNYEFTTASASLGAGSVYAGPIQNNNFNNLPGNPANSDKFIAEYFYQDSVNSFDSFSYDYKIAGNGTTTDSFQFYLNVYTNLPSSSITAFYDCKFDYIPAGGSISDFTTFSIDKNTIAGRVQARNNSQCPDTIAGLPADSTIRLLAINIGDTSGTDQGLAGYIDNVNVSTSGDNTIFDFEPTLSPASKDDCKKDGWKTFNTPQRFKNQGECVSFMAKAKSSRYVLNSADIDGIDIKTKANTWYEVTVSGVWNNRAGELVDAECTSYGGSNWLNAVFGGFSSDLIDVQINEEFVNWGQCNLDHTYTKWVIGDGSPLNLRVFDGDTNTKQQIASWFNDNVGELSVTVTSH